MKDNMEVCTTCNDNQEISKGIIFHGKFICNQCCNEIVENSKVWEKVKLIKADFRIEEALKKDIMEITNNHTDFTYSDYCRKALKIGHEKLKQGE